MYRKVPEVRILLPPHRASPGDKPLAPGRAISYKFMEIFIFTSIALLLAGQVWLFILIRDTSKKIDKALGGAKRKSIMKMLVHTVERSESIEKDLKTLFREDKKNKELMRQMVQKVAVVRFNPFKDMGGDQSFCAAFLDADDSGILFTYLYGQEGGKIYIKNIIQGESEQALSEEEKKALKQANK